MNFGANILWIAIGVAMVALSRSYSRSGPRPLGILLGAIAAAAVGPGLFL